jgi:hypothetical protein
MLGLLLFPLTPLQSRTYGYSIDIDRRVEEKAMIQGIESLAGLFMALLDPAL